MGPSALLFLAGACVQPMNGRVWPGDALPFGLCFPRHRLLNGHHRPAPQVVRLRACGSRHGDFAGDHLGNVPLGQLQGYPG